MEQTIEGRPNINFDWQAEYKKQMKERLGDSLAEYLHDEEFTSQDMYDALLDEVNDLIEYHQKYLKKMVTFKELIMGHRQVDL